MKDSIKARLEALEAHFRPEACYCLVELPDGTEAEKTMEEWYSHRQEWSWKRITRGGGPAVLLLLAYLDNEVAEDAMQAGNTAAAARFTASAAHFLAEYEKGLAGG
jgi:hypothetical protein